jgi:alkanesulfonate monooxygenase SsuD/methylene tetrahydromethanopterin reductase-like flavin-dependent oxidoreductase (luciferase family)
MKRGFGVAAGLDPRVAAPLATRCEELRYASIWSNDTPVASGLDTVASFAKGSDVLDLGVTLALDRHDPAAINDGIERLDLDRGRLWVAIGSGHSQRPVTTMGEALPALRETVPGVRLVLAGMGPRMSALAGSGFDGVFLNWVTPEFAAGARESVHSGAAEAGRGPPPVFGYVRTAVGDDARERLAKEESFYRDLHDGYRRQFARLDRPRGTVGVAAADADEAQKALAEYDALDVVVVRGLASATLESMGALAAAAAPA